MLRQRFASILVFGFLLIPLLGTYALLLKQKKDIKREVKRTILRGIDKTELVFFSFSSSEIRNKLYWEHAKEFEYGGEMYDVVESKCIGDSTYFWCWHDHEETALNIKANDIVKQILGKHPGQKEARDRLSKYWDTLFFSSAFQYHFGGNAEQSSYYSNWIFLYSFHLNSSLCPPPERNLLS